MTSSGDGRLQVVDTLQISTFLCAHCSRSNQFKEWVIHCSECGVLPGRGNVEDPFDSFRIRREHAAHVHPNRALKPPDSF